MAGLEGGQFLLESGNGGPDGRVHSIAVCNVGKRGSVGAIAIGVGSVGAIASGVGRVMGVGSVGAIAIGGGSVGAIAIDVGSTGTITIGGGGGVKRGARRKGC